MLWGCKRASADLSGSEPISPFLRISLDRRAIENNGIQGAISKSENWHCWEGKEEGCSCALWIATSDLLFGTALVRKSFIPTRERR